MLTPDSDALPPMDECMGVVGDSVYDMPLHIASVFVVMIFSFLGTVVPILLGKYFSVRNLLI